MTSIRVVAILAAYNEADIISAVIAHLVENQIDVYLVDNNSTDDTVAEASQWLGRGLLSIEPYPPGKSGGQEQSSTFDWASILRRKEQIALELEADWFIHHDADEIREAPWPAPTLRDAIAWVDSLGYNCIDHVVYDFVPTDDAYRRGMDPRTYFTRYRRGGSYDKVQLKVWKPGDMVTDLSTSGGHEAVFEGRKVFPVPFLLRHYPIRGDSHGRRKVFRERKPRFLSDERALGWHVQYDHLEHGTHRFIGTDEDGPAFDLERARLECMALASCKELGQEAGIHLEHAEPARRELTKTLVQLLEANKVTLDQIASLASGLHTCQGELEGAKAEIDRLRGELLDNDQRLEQLEQARIRLADLQSSLSWRLTTPLRRIWDTLGAILVRWR